MKMNWAALLAGAACFLGIAQAQFRGGPDSFQFAVIGDSGTGGRPQYQVGARLAELQKTIPFHSVLMLGDNLYGSQRPRDFVSKFEQPYAALLAAGVKFYAALGNHDEPSQQSYERFNMGGRNYYSFQPAEHVRVFALDSNRVDRAQLAWLQKELEQAGDDWKIAFFHHPLYSSAMRHGSSLELRAMLEPIFAKYGVAAVFAGHDHTYERVKPQKGVTYFVVGGSAKLRAGSVRPGGFTATSFDTDNSFALFEIDKDTMYFRAVSRTGKVVDEGSLPRPVSEHPITSVAEPAHQ